MIRTRLQIGTQDYAIVNDIPISTNFVQADLREPDKRNASFTKTVTLYGNSDLNKLFENIFEVNIDLQVFDPNKKVEAKYYIDDTQVLVGALQLLKVSLNADNNIVYECSISGNEGNLFIDIGDKYLEELDFSEYNHVYSRANQIDSWSNICKVSGVSTSVGMGKGYYYGFVQRGLGETNSDISFSVKEFLPQLFVREYLSKIFGEHGYTWNSTFLDSTEFKKLIVEPNLNTLELTQTQLEASQWYGGLNSDVAITRNVINVVNFDKETSPFFDLGSQINGTSVTLSNSGYYNIASSLKYKLRVTHTNPAVAYATFTLLSTYNTIEKSSNGGASWFVLNSTNHYFQNVGLGAFQANVNTDYIDTIEVATGEQLFSANDRFRVKAQWNRAIYNVYTPAIHGVRYYDINNVQIGVEDDLAGTILMELDSGATGSSFYGLITKKQTIEGGNLAINQALPKQIKQKDFVKSIMQAFNLYLEFDKNNPKVITIESYNDYFNNGTVDWSNKVDLEKSFEVNPISMVNGKRYIYKYKEDKDFYNQKYLNKYAENYGTKRVDIDNDFLKDDKINELIFSPTPNVANYQLGIAIPKIFKEQEGKNIVPNIRLLYAGGVMNTSAAWTYKQQGLSDQSMTTYGYCGNTDDPQNPTYDLNWDVPKEVYYNYLSAKFTTNNLYNRFHKNFIQNITSKNSKVIVAYLWLSPLDIQTFSFRKKYFIDNAYYVVNKIIDYNPYEITSTKVELIKIINTDLFVPTQSPIYSSTSISAGVDVPLPVSTTSSNLGINSTNLGENSIAIGEGIFIPASASNVLVNASNVTIGENVSNVTVINTSNITVSESNVSYINGVYYPTYTIVSGGLGVDADVNVMSGGVNSNLQNSILIDGN